MKKKQLPNTLPTLQKLKEKSEERGVISKVPKKICAALFIIIISNQKD